MFIPVVSALCGVTLLPIILAFILAMLSTGYSRDILYFYHITKCTGALFTTTVSTSVVDDDLVIYNISMLFYLLQTIVLTFIFFLIWTLYGFLASGIVVIYVELILSCEKLEDIAGPLGLSDPHLCLPLATGLSE